MLVIPDEVSSRYFEIMHGGFHVIQVGYERDGSQVWKVGNYEYTDKQSRTADKECSLGL